MVTKIITFTHILYAYQIPPHDIKISSTYMARGTHRRQNRTAFLFVDTSLIIFFRNWILRVMKNSQHYYSMEDSFSFDILDFVEKCEQIRGWGVSLLIPTRNPASSTPRCQGSYMLQLGPDPVESPPPLPWKTLKFHFLDFYLYY